MNMFIKYIVSIFMGILKRMWYHIKMDILKKELKKEKEDVKLATDLADSAVDDFERSLELFRKSKDQSNSSPAARTIKPNSNNQSDGDTDV